jgi:SRSO17 transposase
VQMIKVRVQTKQGIHVGHEEIAVAYRERQRDDSFKHDYGLADCEVRTWEGWHHHLTLSLLASWFLTQEKQRGGKNISEPHRSPSPSRTCTVAA